jgi:uncharacterized protein YndB with AHSA1/START domain
MDTNTTRATRHIAAPRHEVYRALIDADAISQWKVPDGMTIDVHEHDGREGGTFRISLTYDGMLGEGKTSARTDTYHGHYETLVPDELVVEINEFESSDPAMRAPMTITVTLSDEDGGTRLVAAHEGLPASVPAEDNERGWEQSLAKLAALVERPRAVPQSRS